MRQRGHQPNPHRPSLIDALNREIGSSQPIKWHRQCGTCHYDTVAVAPLAPRTQLNPPWLPTVRLTPSPSDRR
jgi:hypothetical protein